MSSQSVLPRPGPKDYVNDGSTQQRDNLARLHSAVAIALEHERIKNSKAMSEAVWNAARREGLVTKERGKALIHTGYTDSGTRVLRPEECLMLVDRGHLELLVAGVPASMQEAFATVLPAADVDMDAFVAFSYLWRCGYVVRRTPAEQVDVRAKEVLGQLTRNPVFDVFLSVSKGKLAKTPQFRLCVVNASRSPLPGPQQLRALEGLRADQPVRFGVVSHGSVSLFELECR